jgi:diguanylate cyclase (GGDEF)-like protein
MPRLSSQTYCALISAAAVAAVVALRGLWNLNFIVVHPATFVLLASAVILTETLPVKIPRRGDDEEITLSTSFAMALLLAGGLGPAIIAQSVASLVQDIMSRKPAWRIAFNIGQYALSMIAAVLTLRLLTDTSRIGTNHPFTAAQLPGVLASATAFFIVNTGIVGVAVALWQRVSLREYFTRDLFFVVTTAGVLLLLAPIVIATTAYSPALIPLFAAPIMAIHKALWQGARSAHDARHDPLTRLPNRMSFREAVRDAISDRRARACVLLMDLDRFKDVNDTLGHHYGDLLLQQVADRLRDQLREGDQIARLGGDEFAILSRLATRLDATGLAQRVADCLRGPFELEQITVDVQASVGIAMYPEDAEDVETLLQKADVAMYQAKSTRKDVAVYDEGFDNHSPSKLALSADLRAGLQNDEIVAWYQPALDLRTGQVFSVEALVRWEHPRLGLLPPAAFLEMTEHTNLIKPLTQRVLDVALLQAATWRALGIELTMAVNVSPGVLIDEQFPSQVLDALRRAGVPPAQLKLEVTESALMSDPEVAHEVLLELSKVGIEISIDDFGTGYSSLAYLADLPVSEVKIDRSFVGRMGSRSKEGIIVNSTIDLAHNLGLRAIAEGVEELGLISDLKLLGCDAAQGFAISHPLTTVDATNWLLTVEKVPRIGQRKAVVA